MLINAVHIQVKVQPAFTTVAEIDFITRCLTMQIQICGRMPRQTNAEIRIHSTTGTFHALGNRISDFTIVRP